MKKILHFWAFIGFSLTLFGIFWVPKDIADWQEAAAPWGRIFSMLNQNTALWVFSIVALIYIFWIDFRPIYSKWRGRENLKWAENKTRFTIMEAACYVKDIKLSDFEHRDDAKALASELVHYVSRGFYDSFAKKEERYMHRTGAIPRIGVDLNTQLPKDVVFGFKKHGLNSFFPIIDKQIKEELD